MGVVWSEPKKVKEGTLLVTNASIPAEKQDAEEFWDLWKNYKDEIKADGFAMNKYRGEWQINYFHTIASDSYEKSEAGEALWLAVFKKKCLRWGIVLKKIREAKGNMASAIDEAVLEGKKS